MGTAAHCGMGLTVSQLSTTINGVVTPRI